MKTLSTLAALLVLASAATAQTPFVDEDKCDGPVYERKDVERPAKVTSKPEPGFTEEARQNGVCGWVRLSAVLCKNGRVTDVEVSQGLPHGMTERTVAAVKQVTFEPAEKDWHSVSQRMKFEYGFNIGGCGAETGTRTPPKPYPGRLVEAVQVEGNRRMSDEGVLAHIKTRPGDPYDAAHVQRDLQMLLALPNFDRTQTRVTTLEGARGGIVVVFTVKELPVIRSVSFEGMESVSMRAALKAFRESDVGELRETPYDPVRVKRAEGVLKRLLARRGKKFAEVSSRVEQLSAVSVEVTFVVDEKGWRIIHAR